MLPEAFFAHSVIFARQFSTIIIDPEVVTLHWPMEGRPSATPPLGAAPAHAGRLKDGVKEDGSWGPGSEASLTSPWWSMKSRAPVARRANGTVGFVARLSEDSLDVTGPKAARRPASPDRNCETHSRYCRILAARGTVSAFLD